MSKKRSQPLVFKKKDERIVINIDLREVEKKVRKAYPPVTQTHRDKTKYRRGQKHHNQEE